MVLDFEKVADYGKRPIFSWPIEEPIKIGILAQQDIEISLIGYFVLLLFPNPWIIYIIQYIIQEILVKLQQRRQRPKI